MILVVAEQLNLKFMLQHQGKFVLSAKSAREAVRLLQTSSDAIEGVVLDDALPSIRMVTGYIRNKMPELQVVPWQVAQRNSPFRRVLKEAPAGTQAAAPQEDRYVWYVNKRTGEFQQGGQ